MSASGKRVFTIPPGFSFVDALATGLLARFPDPLELGAARVLLPTRRACRSLQEAFLRVGAGKPLLLPRMLPLGDLDTDELTVAGEGLEWAAAEAAELPQAIPPLRRQLLLARLVRRGPDSQVSEEQANRLAEELARLLDQVETEGLDFEALKGLVPEVYAAHWQQTLRFLEIVTQAWPAILAEEGGIGAAERRRRLLELQAAAWKASPPEGPIIAAGSTGSIPATAALIQVIAGLPQGSVVLPGLDQTAAPELWPAIEADPSHPQHGLALLLQRLELEPGEVALWPGCETAEGRAARGRLIGAALWPAAATRGWTEAAGDKSLRAAASELPGLVTRLDAATSGEEAAAIALILRQALETPGKRAALVTPDRDLARRVAAELQRWEIAIDDSAGQPLSRTPPGVFLRLTAALATEALAPLPLLSALKHPLAAGGESPGAFRRKVRALEMLALRGPRPAPGFAGLRQTLKQAKEKTGDLEKWLARLEKRAAGFLGALEARENRLQILIETHIAFAEALAASDTESGADRLWAGEAGEATAVFLDELREAARGETLETASYAGLLSELLAGETMRPRYGSHPRLAILGPLEARLYHADLMVLGGLNEGTWPAESDAGPWLSRPMRAAFGLPPLERRIGLAAHDFAQAFAAPEVVLTRARRSGGAPSVPSRWLLRLDAFLAALGATGAMQARQPWRAWARELDRPAGKPQPCARPAPTPPVAARPRQLSVTRIETWMRDPYALYAEQILRLKAIEDLDAEASAAERGTAIHAALERFVKESPDALPPDALERLTAIGEEVFEALKARPSVHAFWWPRFRRAAAWVIEQERSRRASGLKVHAETRGKLLLGGFTLTAKADRIETRPDGSLAILDYKTGRAPAKKDLASGLAPQLPLEAAIAAAGGFEGLQAGTAAELAFWRLPGSAATPGEAVEIGENLDELVEAARDGLAELIRIFDDPATPYHPQPRPGAAAAFNDYEHLARVKEWSAGGGGET